MKGTLSKFLLILSSLSVILLSGCGSSGGGDSSTTPKVEATLNKLNIEDAKSLFISSSINTSNSENSKLLAYSSNSSTSNKLFKITNDGYIEEVTYKDQNGNNFISIYSPKKIVNIDSRYIYIEFEYNSAYLVNKSTGYIYSLNNIGVACDILNYFDNVGSIQSDSFGNIYYCCFDSNGMNLMKLDTSKPENIAATQLNPTTESVDTFRVDNLGNVLFTGRLRTETSGTSSIQRIRKINGGFYNLDADNYVSYWLGLDGNFYYSSKDDIVKKVIIDANFDITEENYFTENIATGQCIPTMWSSSIFKFSNKIIMIDPNQSKIFEAYNSEKSVKEITLNSFTLDKIVTAVQSSNYLYIACNNNSTIIKVNPSDYSYTILLPEGTYDVTSMSVSDDDKLVFNALRMADGKNILGEIDSNGVLNILDETSNIKTIYLERIK